MIQVVLGWGSFARLPERAPFSPFPSLFGILQCEVPRGHNFLSHLAAALNLDRSGMEGHAACPQPRPKRCFPAPFPALEPGDTRGWLPGDPRPPRPVRFSSDTLNSSGLLCAPEGVPEGGSTRLETLSRTLTWTSRTFLHCPPACNHTSFNVWKSFPACPPLVPFHLYA